MRNEFGCRDVAMQRLYKDFEITQNYFSYRNQQRPLDLGLYDQLVMQNLPLLLYKGLCLHS
ncbi:MAG: hypothetical protein RMY33_024100 [Nostoc sp. DedQUE03]|nr:hypothetical protein [Nostoc sp. DedQUE02]